MLKLNIKTPFFTLTIFLAGCNATSDMLRERDLLPDSLHGIAKSMTMLAKERCLKASGTTETPRDKWQSGRRLDGEWAVRRFYIGNGDWYKATTASQGVIDNIYYNTKSYRFVCGDHQWNSFSNSREIDFKEYGSSERRL
jgi:hypothetical protein